MIRIAQVKLVAAVVGVVLTAGGGVIAVNQLMAQSSAPGPAAVVASNVPATQPASPAEKIRRNEALLEMEGETGNVWLVRGDDGWKLNATNMTKDWPQEKYTEVLTGVQQGNATLVDLTNQINEGKFATFADLAKTVRGMMRGQ